MDMHPILPEHGQFLVSLPNQRDIYELVLKAELSAIEACQVGSPWINMHKALSRY